MMEPFWARVALVPDAFTDGDVPFAVFSQDSKIKFLNFTYLVAVETHRDETGGCVKGAGADLVYSCLLCTEFSDLKYKHGLYEVLLFIWSPLVWIGLNLVVTTNIFMKSKNFLGLSLSAFKQSLSLQIVNDGVVYINQKLTIVAVCEKVNSLCTTADKMIRDLFVIIYLCF